MCFSIASLARFVSNDPVVSEAWGGSAGDPGSVWFYIADNITTEEEEKERRSERERREGGGPHLVVVST